MYSHAIVQTCPQCGLETQSWADRCPRCGHQLQSPGRLRVLGWIQIGVGTVLALAMTGVMVVVAQIIRHSDDPGATERFDGDAFDAAALFGLLGVVLLIGLVSIASGAWQIRYGTRNPTLVRAVLALGAAFVALGVLVQILN